MSPRVGLALGAGGARGFAHIVVLELFDELGVRPAAISGASMGAIVGAAYAAGLSGRELRAYVLGLLRDAVGPILDLGLSVEESIDVVRTFTAFLTGAILRELGSGLTLAVVDPDHLRDRIADIEGSGDDVLASSAAAIAQIDHQALFDSGVELFIDGLATRVERRPRS